MSSHSRLAIVTGGAGMGIGSGVSRVLARDGWDVLIVDRDADLASQLTEDLTSVGGSVRSMSLDLLGDNASRCVVEEALRWCGRVDGLVNNAGIGCVAPLEELTDDRFDEAITINIRAALRLARESAKHLAISGGAIVNMSSVHGRQPLPGFSGYAATKGAIEAMTRGWAVDLGPLGIRVNCVVPGMVDCPQTRELTAKYVEDVDSYLQHWANRRQLLPQLVTNVDVGEVVAFLLSPKSNGITGQSIVVDAGTTLMLTDRD